MDQLKGICKCGSPKSLTQTGNFKKTCGKSECHGNYGKKRPEHSKKMKIQAIEGTNSSFFKKGRKNSYINSVEWKRQVLTNKGISHDCMSDRQLLDYFLIHKSNTIKTRESNISFVKTMFDRFSSDWDLSDIADITSIDSWPDEQIKKAKRVLNSIKTIVANKNGAGVAKRFKKVVMNSFKYNISNTPQIITRSSYEANYINFFEKHKIWWEYETIRVKTADGFYIPDFVFFYKDKKYILEVKGYLLDEQYYFNKKLRFCVAYSNTNNYIMLFTYDSKPKNIENLIQQELKLI